MTDRTHISGSFRDPSGQVHFIDGRVFRTVTGYAKDDFDFVREKSFLKELIEQGKVIPEFQVDLEFLGDDVQNIHAVLEHPRIRFISHPYEWSFSALKSAALLHLDIHISALEQGITLSDATAYNIQFIGPNPIFIDSLSFRRYVDGEFWTGHRQFCEQFINPLLLRCLCGIPHNAWYRGSLEGITANELNSMLTLLSKCSWNVFTQVFLQARLQSRRNAGRIAQRQITQQKLPKAAFIQILKGLRSWIRKMEPKSLGKTTWEDYSNHNSYTTIDIVQKENFIADFCSRVKPGLLFDIGCNTGYYAEVALANGALSVVGFDSDQGALDRSFNRAKDKRLNFLPLYMDAANPSPDQGWLQNEREGFTKRAHADGVIALALVHHLAIGKNIPLDEVVKWITRSASQGVIEFVPKSDPMVQKLLSLRDDIFESYTADAFVSHLENHSKIVKSSAVSSSNRHLYWFSNL